MVTEEIQLKPTNLIVILSGEHNKRVTGCYGHPMIRTPNIDKLASLGTRFTPAYTNGPVCVPARASFATGQYVHKIRYWDNAIAYFGLVSFLDDNIGKILGTLEETGLLENTRVIYSSDQATASARVACGANRQCTRSRLAFR